MSDGFNNEDELLQQHGLLEEELFQMSDIHQFPPYKATPFADLSTQNSPTDMAAKLPIVKSPVLPEPFYSLHKRFS